MARGRKRDEPDDVGYREPKRSDSIAIVEAILAATEDAVAQGSPSASTNEIARRAGVGVASLYRYFDDRRSILGVLRRQLIERRRHRMLALAARRDLEPAQMIRSACEILLDQDRENRALKRTLLLEVPFDWVRDIARENDELTITAIATWLEEELDIEKEAAKQMAFVSLYATHGVVARWSMAEGDVPPLSREDLLRQLVTLWSSYFTSS